MVLYQDLILLGVGLLLLVKGADFLVDSASRIAKTLGVSDLIVGLTIVSVGTSIPELATAISASLAGEGDLVVGSIVGSNIANICLVFGISAVIINVKSEKIILRRDGYIMLAVFVLLYIFMLIGNLGLLGGILFISIFLAYIAFLAKTHEGLGDDEEFRGFVKYFVKFDYVKTMSGHLRSKFLAFRPKKFLKNPSLARKQILKDVFIIALGIFMVVLGAVFLVDGATGVASGIGIKTGIIGLTIVAVGTSLPEIIVSLNAAKKHLDGLAIGNVVGSCVANTLLILGMAAIIRPIGFEWRAIAFTAPFMILVGATLLIMMHRESIGRKGGLLLIGLYGLFMVLLLGLFL